MFAIGKVNQEELKQLQDSLFTSEVQEISQADFNRALDPNYDPEKDPDLIDEDGEKLVCVFVDLDLTDVLIHRAI